MDKNIKISVLTSLYNCESFLSGYFKALSKIKGTDMMEVLLLHNDPQEKELAIIRQYLPSMDFVRHIVIPEREGLYATWNRGISLAKGEYITVWNVDDIRFPDSILQQAEALDKNPEAALVYGDIWLSERYGVPSSISTKSPVDNRNKEFFKAFYISCFQMWRKSIHQSIGYYDEQFKCVADFDFQMRAAIHFPFVKTKEMLGIYLERQPHKLSFNGLQIYENNIVYLRYGAYENLNLFLLNTSKKKYQRDKLSFYDKWTDFTEKSQFGAGHKTWGLCIAFFRSLIWLLKISIKKLLRYKKL
jgi:glycosyltransferase involved in cell wall biosynthesis